MSEKSRVEITLTNGQKIIIHGVGISVVEHVSDPIEDLRKFADKQEQKAEIKNTLLGTPSSAVPQNQAPIRRI